MGRLLGALAVASVFRLRWSVRCLPQRKAGGCDYGDHGADHAAGNVAARYDKRLAAGTVAATATLAQNFPPATVLVLLGDQMSTAYQSAQLSKGIFAPTAVTVSDLFAGAKVFLRFSGEGLASQGVDPWRLVSCGSAPLDSTLG